MSRRNCANIENGEKQEYIDTMCWSYIHSKCNMSEAHVPDTITETVNYA